MLLTNPFKVGDRVVLASRDKIKLYESIAKEYYIKLNLIRGIAVNKGLESVDIVARINIDHPLGDRLEFEKTKGTAIFWFMMDFPPLKNKVMRYLEDR